MTKNQRITPDTGMREGPSFNQAWLIPVDGDLVWLSLRIDYVQTKEPCVLVTVACPKTVDVQVLEGF